MITGQLTKVQTDTMDYMLKFVKEVGRKPTYQEIADHFGLASTASAYARVQNMERALGLCPWCQRKKN
jgi:SOS-response transcriptional repressor LexA